MRTRDSIMKSLPHIRSLCFSIAILLIVTVFLFFAPLSGKTLPESKSLGAWVKTKPAFPIVFTSRSEPTSFVAAADAGEGFAYPGTIPWKAAEGRLRLLTTRGGVVELTWNRSLDDGSTLIDVMSPTVSVDGKRILFAGRKAAPDPGRWRIYEFDLTSDKLRQITGLAEDAGCVAVPPLRFAADGSRLQETERRQIDFDDVDPVDLGPKGIAFVSSRLPDLGRDHARRATQIWRLATDAHEPVLLSANRNNDRWPFLLGCDRILFSSWSRVTEGVTFNRKQVKPFSEGGSFANHPYENWMGARLTPNGAEFGYAIKSAEPVWRPRPLFNGRVVYMTETQDEPGRLRIAQADWGYIRSSPSSLAYDTQYPDQGNAQRLWGPQQDAEGNDLVCGCPSPVPDDSVLFSGAIKGQEKGVYALYQTSDDWNGAEGTGADRSPQMLFDDPHLVDAEPVAVYARSVQFIDNDQAAIATNRHQPESIPFASGATYRGPMGYLENLAVLLPVRSPIPWNPAKAGSRVDPQIDPLIPPPTMVQSIAFYGSHRDRFDDPQQPRIKGRLEALAIETLRKQGDTLEHWVPSDPLVPTLLAGLDSEGKIATWQGKAKDPLGKIATYIAFAGDHYSAAKPNGYHYCNGCHTGHTFLSLSARESKAK